MAEDTVRLGGLPYRTSDPEQTESALANGGTLISEAEGSANAAAQADNSYVDENWGVAGKLGMGALGGLTLGMGPGALANMGLLNPGHLHAAQASPWYTVGDVAGTIAPALLTGGESLGARAIGMTPAGLMGRAGGLAENWAGRLLGDSAGLLGKLGSAPIKMAARGAAEGGLISMGHAIGDALIDNKPLAAEAIGAAGVDGLLFGALMGGTLGTVGSLGTMAVDGISNVGSKVAGRGASGVESVGKHLGMAAEDLTDSAVAKTKIGKYGDILHEGGSSIGDSAKGQVAAAKKYIDVQTAARNESIAALREDASGALEGLRTRLQPRLVTDVVHPRIGTPMANTAEREVEKFWSSFSAEKPMGRPQWNEANGFRSYAQWLEDGSGGGLNGTAKRAAYDDYKSLQDVSFEKYSKTAKSDLGRGGFPTTWDGVIKARDTLENELVGKANNPLLPSRDTVRREILNALDHEIGQAMDGVSTDVSNKYRASTQSMQVGRELEAHLGKRLSNDLQASSPAITSRDAGWAITGSALGHPAAAVSFLAAKGISKIMQPKVDSWMAQMAYNNSFGTKAAGATQDLKGKISSSLKAYFKAGTKVPVTTKQVQKAEKRPQMDRKAYEDMASKAEQLVSNNHQAKVREYAESMAAAGYSDLAEAMLEANHRAVMYTMFSMPPRAGAKQMQSLHKISPSKTPTLEEFKYIRKLKGVMGGPHAIIDGLMDGSLSRDTVQAFAYTYPESASFIAQTAGQEIMEMKSRGDFLPMDKISRLGLALNAPIDRTLEGDYISSVQGALSAPPADKPQTQQPQSSGSIGQVGQALMTPLQTITFQA